MSLESEEGIDNTTIPVSFASRRPNRVPIIIGIVILIERAFTLLYWNLESNPVVLGLGRGNWVLVTIVLFIAYCYCWYGLRAYQLAIAYVVSGGIVAFHLGAIAVNALIVLRL